MASFPGSFPKGSFGQSESEDPRIALARERESEQRLQRKVDELERSGVLEEMRKSDERKKREELFRIRKEYNIPITVREGKEQEYLNQQGVRYEQRDESRIPARVEQNIERKEITIKDQPNRKSEIETQKGFSGGVIRESPKLGIRERVSRIGGSVAGRVKEEGKDFLAGLTLQSPRKEDVFILGKRYERQKEADVSYLAGFVAGVSGGKAIGRFAGGAKTAVSKVPGVSKALAGRSRFLRSVPRPVEIGVRTGEALGAFTARDIAIGAGEKAVLKTRGVQDIKSLREVEQRATEIQSENALFKIPIGGGREITSTTLASSISPGFISQKNIRKAQEEFGISQEQSQRQLRGMNVRAFTQPLRAVNVELSSERLGRGLLSSIRPGRTTIIKNIVRGADDIVIPSGLRRIKTGFRSTFTRTAPSLGVAGGFEGFAEYLNEVQQTGQKFDIRRAATFTGAGVVIAPTVGGSIAGLDIAGRLQRSAGKRTGARVISAVANIVDPFEKPGDFVADIIEKTQRRVGIRTVTPAVTQRSRETFEFTTQQQGKRQSTAIRTPTQVKFGIPNLFQTPTQIQTPTQTPTQIKIPTTTFTQTPAQTKTQIQTETQVAVTLPTSITIPTTVPTLRFPFPIPPAVGGGGRGFGFRFPKRSKKFRGATRSVFAAAFNLPTSQNVKRGFAEQTGLQLRL